MRKIYFILVAFFSGFISSAQCPAPSNFIVTNFNPFEAVLSWTENGTATSWEVTFDPNYSIGSQPSSVAWIAAPTNPFVITGLPSGCNVFFVRSRCSLTIASTFAIAATTGCSSSIFNYIATLSNDSFENNDTNKLTLFPNPTNNILKLNYNSFIDKVIISDLLGKVILVETNTTNEINVESLSKGIYIVEVISGKDTFFSKFIKE